MHNLTRLVRTNCFPAFATLFLATAVGGCGQPAADRQSSRNAGVSPATVTVVQPQRRSIRRVVEQPGTVQAFEETQLFARVPGYVSKVHFDIGQKVESGQVLAEIDVPELVEETNQKKALTR